MQLSLWMDQANISALQVATGTIDQCRVQLVARAADRRAGHRRRTAKNGTFWTALTQIVRSAHDHDRVRVGGPRRAWVSSTAGLRAACWRRCYLSYGSRTELEKSRSWADPAAACCGVCHPAARRQQRSWSGSTPCRRQPTPFDRLEKAEQSLGTSALSGVAPAACFCESPFAESASLP